MGTKRFLEFGLSLGSNVGDRLQNLAEAKRRIKALPGITVVAQSRAYETEPVGVPLEFDDFLFLNAVLIIEADLAPGEIHRKLQAIEKDMGRRLKSVHNTPRSIDIDIIYAGRKSLRAGELVIPHPRWAERRFVVQPLADVRPDLKIPGRPIPVRDVLLSLPGRPEVVCFAADW